MHIFTRNHQLRDHLAIADKEVLPIIEFYLEALMTTLLEPKQLVSFEELLMSQVVHAEALTRLLYREV